MNAITIDLERTDFTGGDTVRGVCRLHLEEPLPLRGVRVRFHGFERAEWSEGSGKNRRTRRAERSFFDHVETLFGQPALGVLETVGDVLSGLTSKDRYERLPAGDHAFPFEYRLPVELPPDFESGGASRIAYEITASVDLPVKFDLTVTRRLTIHAPPAGDAPLPVSRSGEKSFLFGGDEHVRVSAALERDAFHPGDPLRCRVEIDNPGDRRIDAVLLDLKRVLQLSTGSATRTVEEPERLAAKNLRESPAARRRSVVLDAMLPDDLYATIDAARFVRVEYAVVVRLDLPWAVDLSVEIPIRIDERPDRPSGPGGG